MKLYFNNLPAQMERPPQKASRQKVARLSAILVTSIIALCTLMPFPAAAQSDAPFPFYPLPDTENVSGALRSTSIVGGEEAAPDSWSWTVALVRSGRDPYYGQFCGGTLIDAQWVLTAAHCVVGDSTTMEPDDLYIWANSHSLTGTTGDRVDVKKVIPHTDFSRATAENDIALLKLASPLTGPYVGLPTTEALRSLAAPSTTATVIGWGTTATQSRVDQRHQVDVPIVDRPTCATVYSNWALKVTETMICAGYAEGGFDACSGDSGGPLVVPNPDAATSSDEPEWIEAGIVSWGRGCAQADSYGVYTDIASFVEWIAAQRSAAQSEDPEDGGTAIIPEEQGPHGAESSFRTFLPVIER